MSPTARETELLVELQFQMDKLKYHYERLYALTNVVEPIETPFNWPPRFPTEADYECDAIIQTTKKIIDMLCRLIIIKKTDVDDKDFSLQRFFQSLKSKDISVGKSHNVCSDCQKSYSNTMKKYYLKIFEDTELVTFLLKEYDDWIKKVIDIRTVSVHGISKKTESVKSLMITDESCEGGERRINQWSKETYGFAAVVYRRVKHNFSKYVLYYLSKPLR